MGTEENPKRRLSRRRFLRQLGGGAAATVGGTYVYARWLEPFRPVVERVTITLPFLPPTFDGFRIAHLSDLHIQPAFPAKRLEPVLALLEAEKPDLVALTGDYVYDQIGERDRWTAECVSALRGLKAPQGVFTTFGNHDFPDKIGDPRRDVWEKAGIQPLINETTLVEREGETIHLIGLRSMIMRPVNPFEVISPLPQETTRILLWHEPDDAGRAAAAGASLQLSGHTHGGQVVVPGYGPPRLPIGGQRYPAGLFNVAGMPLYVTRGVGVLPPLVRLNCPPEVTLLTLRRR
jgi:predicted MPP superfamily phosphohydrolase